MRVVREIVILRAAAILELHESQSNCCVLRDCMLMAVVSHAWFLREFTHISMYNTCYR